MANFVQRIANGLSRIQGRYPVRFLLAALIFTLAIAPVAATVKFESSYEALLPQNDPEVKNLVDARKKTGGFRPMIVALGDGDAEGRIGFGKKLVARIAQLENVRSVEFEYPVGFFNERSLWLVDDAKLESIISRVQEAVSASRALADPLGLHLDSEKEKQEADLAWSRVDALTEGSEAYARLPRYLTSKDGELHFVVIVPSIKFSDMRAGTKFSEDVEGAIFETQREIPEVTATLVGSLAVYQETHQKMKRDLAIASALALLLSIGIIAGFSRSLRAPLLIALGLIPGLVCTFAAAKIVVGNLNIITGFSGAVLVGLGVDFGVHLYFRYRELIARKPRHPKLAMAAAVDGVALPILASALTTGSVFLTFYFSEFRGFSEFGLIACIGIAMTLLSCIVVLPPLLLLFGPGKGLEKMTSETAEAGSNGGFWRFRVSLITILSFAFLAILGVISVPSMVFENNLRELRGESHQGDLLDNVDNNLDGFFDPAVVITQNIDDARLVGLIARKHIRKIGNGVGIRKALSASDFLPPRSEDRSDSVKELRAILWDARLDKVARSDSSQGEKLRLSRIRTQYERWSFSEIPEIFRKRLTTLEGDEYMVYLWPNERLDSDLNARAWKAELSSLSGELDANGVPHRIVDESLLLAFISDMVRSDGPKLLGVATLVVVLILIVTLRSFKGMIIVMTPMLVALGLFTLIVRAMGIELNMYNMIVLPSIMGIGVDGVIHVYHRYRVERPSNAYRVIRKAGMGVTVASLTTAAGYGAAIVSHNLGLKSFGLLALLGIGSTLICTLFFFSSFLVVLSRMGKSTDRAVAK